jgi:hypothetical protein
MQPHRTGVAAADVDGQVEQRITERLPHVRLRVHEPAVGGNDRPGPDGRHRALTEDESEAVFRRWMAGERQVDLAAEFGIHQGTISRACANRRKGRLRRGPVPLL